MGRRSEAHAKHRGSGSWLLCMLPREQHCLNCPQHCGRLCSRTRLQKSRQQGYHHLLLQKLGTP